MKISELHPAERQQGPSQAPSQSHPQLIEVRFVLFDVYWTNTHTYIYIYRIAVTNKSSGRVPNGKWCDANNIKYPMHAMQHRYTRGQNCVLYAVMGHSRVLCFLFVCQSDPSNDGV